MTAAAFFSRSMFMANARFAINEQRRAVFAREISRIHAINVKLTVLNCKEISQSPILDS
jgi:hypothetical protein